jgi:protease IV
VDQLGGLEDAIKAAAQAAKISEWQIDEYPKPRSLEEQLGRLFSGRSVQTPTNPLTQELQKLGADLHSFQSMNDPLNVYSRLMFDLRIH